jgi:mannitol-specific phosphotransferase system IIBC component
MGLDRLLNTSLFCSQSKEENKEDEEKDEEKEDEKKDEKKPKKLATAQDIEQYEKELETIKVCTCLRNKYDFY